jgi:hypothetical protein
VPEFVGRPSRSLGSERYRRINVQLKSGDELSTRVEELGDTYGARPRKGLQQVPPHRGRGAAASRRRGGSEGRYGIGKLGERGLSSRGVPVRAASVGVRSKTDDSDDQDERE